MKSNEFKSMSTDELWDLYETITSMLFKKIDAEKAELEERLRKLESVSTVGVKGVAARTRRSVPNTRTLKTPRKFGQAGANNLAGYGIS
jgi:DNA-binding protein H-NS